MARRDEFTCGWCGTIWEISVPDAKKVVDSRTTMDPTIPGVSGGGLLGWSKKIRCRECGCVTGIKLKTMDVVEEFLEKRRRQRLSMEVVEMEARVRSRRVSMESDRSGVARSGSRRLLK